VTVAAEEIASAVAEAMRELLSKSSFSIENDFFLSGGDSLRVVRLITRLTEQFTTSEDDSAQLGADLLVAVFDEATPVSLGAIIGRHLA